LLPCGLTFKATDFEARSDVAYRVKVQAIRTVRLGVIPSIITAEKTITVTVTDLDDEAPTNIQISNTNLLKGQPAGTVVGTLSATDIDTAADALTFTITNNADFEIVNRNQLKTKRPIAAIGDMTITVSGFKVGGSKGKCVATKAKFSLIGTTGNSKTYITYITSVCRLSC
jgi:hypothetical protein